MVIRNKNRVTSFSKHQQKTYSMLLLRLDYMRNNGYIRLLKVFVSGFLSTVRITEDIIPIHNNIQNLAFWKPIFCVTIDASTVYLSFASHVSPYQTGSSVFMWTEAVKLAQLPFGSQQNQDFKGKRANNQGPHSQPTNKRDKIIAKDQGSVFNQHGHLKESRRDE